MKKLYTVTRRDLSPGQKVAQSIHGVSNFISDHEKIYKDWFETSNVIVCLEVKDETALRKLKTKCETRGVKHSVFLEPDMNNELTCLVIEPNGNRLCSNISLVRA